MSRLTIDRLQSECDDVIAIVTRLRADLPELLRRAEHAARDGYPASSIGTGGGGGVSRPTENAALAPVPPDPVRAYVKRLLSLLDETSRNAASLDGLRAVALETGDAERGRTNTVDQCANCGGPCVPRAREDRCWPCYEYRRRTGEERPRERWGRKASA